MKDIYVMLTWLCESAIPCITRKPFTKANRLLASSSPSQLVLQGGGVPQLVLLGEYASWSFPGGYPSWPFLGGTSTHMPCGAGTPLLRGYLHQCIMGKVTWDPPPELDRQTNRQTRLKTLPSCKLRMRAVIN